MLSCCSTWTTLASTSLACTALLLGCADPEGRYEDFAARDAKIRQEQGGTGGGSCAPTEAGAADGDFLFSLSASINPPKPVVFLAKLTTEAGDAGLRFSLNVQALLASDRKTPTGMAVDVGPYDVGADGSFIAALPTLSVPGNGNPISGSDLEATITLAGGLCAPADFICGDVTGNLTKPFPIDLQGSTFAMVRITDPAAYPDAVINCDEDPAAPLQ